MKYFVLLLLIALVSCQQQSTVNNFAEVLVDRQHALYDLQPISQFTYAVQKQQHTTNKLYETITYTVTKSDGFTVTFNEKFSESTYSIQVANNYSCKTLMQEDQDIGCTSQILFPEQISSSSAEEILFQGKKHTALVYTYDNTKYYVLEHIPIPVTIEQRTDRWVNTYNLISFS